MAQETVEVPLRLKDHLQITIKGTGDVIPTTYMSRVEKMSDGEIAIRWPAFRGVRAPIQDNNLLCMFFIKGSEAFTIDARVVKLILYPSPAIVVRCEGPLRKTQRRDFVRVPAMIDVRLSARLIVATASGDERASYIITTTTVDISGGGFNIHHCAPMPMGSIYDVKMKIPTLEQPLSLTAKVVRMEAALNSKNETYYDIGFLFIQIEEPIRRQIIKYVFRFQQNSLAKQR
jgi:hypothetical protein